MEADAQMSPKIESAITGGVTILAIVGIGVLKTAGWIDADITNLAVGLALGGGLGYTGKVVTSSSPPSS